MSSEGPTRREAAADELDRAADAAPIVNVTDSALAMILEIRSGEPDAESLALWLEVSGVTNGNYAYDMYFQALSDTTPGDAVQQCGSLPVVVREDSIEKLKGATLDTSGVEGETGMVMINPNVPPQVASPPMGRPPGELSGEVAERVMAVLDRQVNPSIAMHGGRADLVAVEEGTAYLRLSGGCQGCGLATVTLGQGIEVAIKDAVPEIVSVIDVTDHASGTNPYFEPAKK